ncbi:MAG: hypothetical protein QXV32_05870 [Conexivisphaerales archaeon]
MEKVVVVNDCAHVFEDLIPELKNDYEIEFIQRTRSLTSKTFSLLWQILRADGSLYHVNYALQDAYLVSKLKHHLDVLHIHGSDIRQTIDTSKYGWMVRSNLKNARRVVYATPDLEDRVKTYRNDAVYLPTPVRLDLFNLKSHYNPKPVALAFRLAYEEIPPLLIDELNRYGIDLTVLERNIPYSKMPETLAKYDIFIDRFTIPSLSKTCLEAMSTGLATIDYRHLADLSSRIRFLSDPSNVKAAGEENRKYVEANHDSKVVAKNLSLIWDELLQKR